MKRDGVARNTRDYFTLSTKPQDCTKINKKHKTWPKRNKKRLSNKKQKT